MNDKEIIIKSKKETGRAKNDIPKKQSLWKKILGGIAVGVGIIAAPFTGGASLVISAGGVGLIAGGKIDDAYNEEVKEKSKKK